MESGKMGVGFVGAGKVGCSLGRLFREKGLPLVGYVSRHAESAVSAAAMTESRAFATLEGLVAESDILFLTVPDGSIVPVWEQELAKLPLEGKLVCHASGSLPASVLVGAARSASGPARCILFMRSAAGKRAGRDFPRPSSPWKGMQLPWPCCVGGFSLSDFGCSH